jgi:hypothetical protein
MKNLPGIELEHLEYIQRRREIAQLNDHAIEGVNNQGSEEYRKPRREVPK